jgi:hypothetical protein
MSAKHKFCTVTHWCLLMHELCDNLATLTAGILHSVVWQSFADISSVLPASITRALAYGTSRMSVNIYETPQCNNSECCHIYTHCHKNLKSNKTYAQKKIKKYIS